MGRELMRIVRDLPVKLDLDAARLGDYDRETVIRLFREFEFRTLIERLPPLKGERADETAAAIRGTMSGDEPMRAAQVPGSPVRGAAGWGAGDVGRRGRSGAAGEASGLQLALDFSSMDGAVAPTPDVALPAGKADPGAAREPLPVGVGPDADLAAVLAAAIENPGSRIEIVAGEAIEHAEPWLAAQSAVGVSLLADDPRPRKGTPLALAVAGLDGRTIAAEGGADVDRLRALLERLDVPIVGHEVKPLLVARFALDPNGPATPIAFDTQVAAYILNASLRSQSIADVVAEQLDLILPPAKELPPFVRAGLEALSAVAARIPLEAALERESLDRLFREIELPLIPVLARMEAAGVALDREALKSLADEFAIEIARLEAEVYASVGHEFNLGSPKQLEQVLFFELNLPKGKKTKTGYSTDASVLEDLRGVHPMVASLLDWRTYTKLRSTYVEALPTLIADDGRLHTTFHQAVAATGRLSSSDPNLQNIPIRTPLGRRIRRAFVAGAPDVTLVAADYSQIELRILAHVSGDEHLRDAFARGADIHRETAARVLHKAPEEVNADERSMAKMVNFGIAYGMSDFGLSSRANIPRADAQEFINTYFATYSGISYYMLHIKEVARRQGYVTTLLGRKRAISGARRAQPDPARGGRADGDQHAHPGHRRGHHQDRHDPPRRAPPGGRLSGPAAAPGPRRAAPRGAPRRGRPADPGPALDDGIGACPRRAADRRRQGRRRLGGDDGPPARGRPARACLSCPRSRPSSAISGRGSSAPRSAARARPGRGPCGRTIRARSRRPSAAAGSRRSAGAPSCWSSSCRAARP